ncbi:hypothetical protein, partial [Paraburkholderia humisilvae]|uniref:hypothetical protein n=1 Tax=Paraburkholderia humisilvae TaxID=627669 RepID=UPI0035EF2F2F
IAQPPHPTITFLRVRRALQQRSEIMQTSTHAVNRFLTSPTPSHAAQSPAITGAPAFRTLPLMPRNEAAQSAKDRDSSHSPQHVQVVF